jgi:polysaccharide biosynthesis protein PslF
MSRLSPELQIPARVGMVSTYPPTRCGIATFAFSLVEALSSSEPALDLQVVRLLPDSAQRISRGAVVMEIDPNSSVSLRAAARHLSGSDVAILQHEFGIYGGDEGESVLDLVSSITTPRIVVLHTVLPKPTRHQAAIIRALAAEARLVVLCQSASHLLEREYSISTDSVMVVPHGAHWSAQPANRQPRRRLITWGLLGPGKGLERSLEAIARLRDFDPRIKYQIVGRTHPSVVARSGYQYRTMLENMVADLRIGEMVEFVDRYVADTELFDLVRLSDVVIAPYDNDDQVSSGVITEAVGMARPVVATRFPYSEEILGSGAGLLVEHDGKSIADAVRKLLEDPIAYRTAATAAKDLSAELSWARVAAQYSRLIRSMSAARATA